jgi:hypothetical protein
MNKRLLPLISLLLLVVLAGSFLAACGSSTTPAAPSSGGTGGGTDGKSLLQSRCTVCHSLSRVTSRQETADGWKSVVDKMINNGAQLTPQEEQTLVTYLAQTYHP